jgi:hypothetical protein
MNGGVTYTSQTQVSVHRCLIRRFSFERSQVTEFIETHIAKNITKNITTQNSKVEGTPPSSSDREHPIARAPCQCKKES